MFRSSLAKNSDKDVKLDVKPSFYPDLCVCFHLIFLFSLHHGILFLPSFEFYVFMNVTTSKPENPTPADSFLRVRATGDHEATAMMKAQFLQQWDGLATDNSRFVVVMGATNRPQDVDRAILRRMPAAFHIPLPVSTCPFFSRIILSAGSSQFC